MMTDPTPPAANSPHPTTEIRSLAIVVPPNTAGDAVMEALWGNVNFNLTATALQRQLDRMGTYKRERSKTFGAAAKAAVKELKLHATGEPWQRFMEVQIRLSKAMKAKEELDLADIDQVMRFGAANSRLYSAAEEAVKAKKDEVERINAKIAKVESALRTHLRKGPGGHDVEEESIQTTIPGIVDAVPEPWMDEQTRQVTYDTLTSELRVIDRDLAAANMAQDAAKVRRAEAARGQYRDLLDTLRAASLLVGLTPDEEDYLVVAAVEDDGEDLDIDLDDDEEAAAKPAGEAPFKLAPDGLPEGLADPTRHPALQPAINAAKSKRQAKKDATDGGVKKTAKKRNKRGK